MANSAALVTDAFPRRELGRALGINAMVVGAGLILGPILGGWLTSFGWQTVFWFNVPIGLVGTIAAATLLVEQGRRSGRGRASTRRQRPLPRRPDRPRDRARLRRHLRLDDAVGPRPGSPRSSSPRRPSCGSSRTARRRSSISACSATACSRSAT